MATEFLFDLRSDFNSSTYIYSALKADMSGMVHSIRASNPVAFPKSDVNQRIEPHKNIPPKYLLDLPATGSELEIINKIFEFILSQKRSNNIEESAIEQFETLRCSQPEVWKRLIECRHLINSSSCFNLRDLCYQNGLKKLGDWLAQFNLPIQSHIHDFCRMLDHDGAWIELLHEMLPTEMNISAVPVQSESIKKINRNDFLSSTPGIQFSFMPCPDWYQHEGENIRLLAKNTLRTYPFAQLNNLVIAKMGVVGQGLFAGHQGLKKDSEIPYGGRMHWVGDSKCRTSFYLVQESFKPTIDGQHFRHYGCYAQHCPTSIEKFSFIDPELSKEVAIANAIIESRSAIGFSILPLVTLQLISDVDPYKMVCADYGMPYWLALDRIPELFDKSGRIIPKAFYNMPVPIKTCGRIFMVDTKHIRNCVDRIEDMSASFENVQITIPYFDLKEILIKYGFLSDPMLVNTTNINECFLNASEAGDVMLLDYLFRSQSYNPNINCAQTSTGKSALHLAIENGHYYTAYYLLLKGARCDVADTQGKTPIDVCANQTDMKALIEKFQSLSLAPSMRR